MQKITRIFFFLFFIAAVVPFLWSADPVPAPEITALPHSDGTAVSIQSRTVFPHEITLYEYSNGLTLFVQQNPSQFAEVSAYIKNTGSAYEGEWLGTGISHLTEHIVCAGTTLNHTRTESRNILGNLGSSFDAFTEKEFTRYYIDSSSDTILTALDLLADWVTRCTIDSNEFNTEKTRIAKEIRERNENPDTIDFELLWQTVYRKTALRHPFTGYEDRFQTLTRDDVQQFYHSRYTPNNTIFLITGNVDADATAQYLAELYRGIPRGPEISVDLPAEPPQTSSRTVVREREGTNCQLLLAWPTVTMGDPDAPVLYVLASLLTGRNGGRLNRHIKDENQHGPLFEAKSYTNPTVSGFFLIKSKMSLDENATVDELILDQLSDLSETEPSSDELRRAVSLTELDFISERKTAAVRANASVKNYIITGNPNFDEEYLDSIRNVTPGDITRVAQKYFSRNRLNRVLATPIGASPFSANTNTADTNVNGQQITANGLSVLTKRLPGVPTVTVQIHILCGLLADDQTNAGRTALLAKMLKGGSQNYSKTDIENFFDLNGGSLNFSIGRSTLIAKMTILKENFPEAMKILGDMILNPLFKEEEFLKAKKEQSEKILARQNKPEQYIFEIFSEGLPESSPYHLQVEGTSGKIENISLNDMIDFYHQILDPSRMVISVFGDVDSRDVDADSGDVISKVVDIYADVKKPANPAPLKLNGENAFLNVPNIHKKLQTQSGYGIAAWPAVSQKNEKDYAALTVLQGILGGNGISGGRLSEKFRDNGLAKNIIVNQMCGPCPGYFYIYFITEPDKINEVFNQIEIEIRKIKEGNISEEELSRVKKQIINFRNLQNESIDTQENQIAVDVLYGFAYNYEEHFADRINAVTSSDVIAAAQKYLTATGRFSISPNDNR